MPKSAISDDFIALDVETTGIANSTDKLIEVAAIRYTHGEAAGEFASLINPGIHIPARITELTGIRDEDVAEAPFLEDVYPSFHEFIGDLPILGHSVLFDYGFLKRAALSSHLSFEKKGIDTCKLARRFLPELPHKSLSYLCEYYHIETIHHRALADAESAAKVYFILAEDYLKDETADIFAPKPMNYRIKKTSPATKAQQEKLQTLSIQYPEEAQAVLAGVNDYSHMTKAQASRAIDLILSSRGLHSPQQLDS